MPRRARRTLLAPTAAALVLLLAAPVRAQETARQVYERAASAFDAGRYGDAARDFARADEMSPNPVALESAVRAASLADDAPTALELCDRADGRPGSPALTTTVQRARERFAGRAGKLTVRCRPAETCTLRVDGAAAEAGAAHWRTAGDHAVEVEAASERERFTVAVAAGATVGWEPPPRLQATPAAAAMGPSSPAAPPPPGADVSAAESRGISPAFFWVGAGATVVLGGVTAWSGLDTLDRHRKWDDGDDAAKDAGKAAQLRTNVLIGVTGALALGTAAIGIWAVDWGGSAPKSARVAVAPGGITATFRY
ncbi:MAG: hypothetical protein WKG00_38115 [Polyangiaceae bacterium]